MSKITNNIMVLDDDPFMLKLIAHMLESQGCTSVITCSNGHDALEVVDSPRARPDLIFLDLNLPGMDGMEFVRRLVEHNYGGSLVLMSGEDEHLLRASTKLVQVHKIPVLGSFPKPISMENLKMVLGVIAQYHQDNAAGGNGTRVAEELRIALAESEMINHYQPVVSLASGKVVAVEALARWRKASGELVLPYKFLGVAEAFGLIHDLARVLLTDALTQVRAWQDAGMPLHLTVNVSEYSVEALDFADAAAELVAAAGVPPQHVVLEVAEGWLPMNDLRVPLETLTRLHLKRFRLALDEFGTGYSTVTQLRDLPFDQLKIDRSFVQRVATDAKIKAKYEACLSIARQLNVEVVAVGVDNIDDWHLLRLTGCDYAQGSFIAEPMPAEALSGWIRDWQSRINQEQNLFAGQGSGSFIH